jgi:hypothetical protein
MKPFIRVFNKIWFSLSLVALIGLGFQNCAGVQGLEDLQDGKVVVNCVSSVPGSCTVAGTVGSEISLASLPTEVQKKIDECKYSVGFFGSSGNGLMVDWGDGKVDPPYSDDLRATSCSDVVSKHIYLAAGTYTITVTSWHPGPTDMPINDWKGTVQVTISP